MMKPTPHRLALLMSLAGFGASLGQPVQARVHLPALLPIEQLVATGTQPREPAAEAPLVLSAGLPVSEPAARDDAAGGTAPADAVAAPPPARVSRQFHRRGDGEQADAVVEPSADSDDRLQAVPSVVARAADPLPAMTPAPAVDHPFSHPTAPQAPATHRAGNGLRVRQPKAPPPSLGPWQSILMDGDDPKARPSPDDGTDAGQGAIAGGGPAATDGADGFEASPPSVARAVVPARMKVAAGHRLRLHAPSEQPSGKVPGVGIEAETDAATPVDVGAGRTADAGTGVDVDLGQAATVDVDLGTALHGGARAAATVDIDLKAPAADLGVDLALDLDLDLGRTIAMDMKAAAAAPVAETLLWSAGRTATAVDVDVEADPGRPASPVVDPGRDSTTVDLEIDLSLGQARSPQAGPSAAMPRAAAPAIRLADAESDRRGGTPGFGIDLELDLDLPLLRAGDVGARLGDTLGNRSVPQRQPAAVRVGGHGKAVLRAAAEATGPGPAFARPDLPAGTATNRVERVLLPGVELPWWQRSATAPARPDLPAEEPLFIASDPAWPAADMRPARVADEADTPAVTRLPALSVGALPAAVPVAPARQAPVAAQHRPEPAGGGLGELLAVSESSLDEVRGGFQTETGLQISFGIERAVYINGSLVATPTVSVVDPTGGAARSLPGNATGNVALIQNGAGNTFATGPVSPSAVGTVIQNTLDGQSIQNVTTINATVNSLQMVRAQNFESSLRGAIIDSLRR